MKKTYQMWSDQDLTEMMAHCYRKIQLNEKSILVDPSKLAMSLAELLAFRQMESSLLEKTPPNLGADQPHE